MNIKICGVTRTNPVPARRGWVNADFLKRGLARIFILVSCFLFLASLTFAAETFYAAGRGTKDKGAIWKYKNGRWIVHSVIPDCSEIFVLAMDKNGNLLAGGNHFGYGTVWQYTEKGWDKGAQLSECHGLYALAVDQKGDIWAGGAGTKNIWRYDGTKWDSGVELNGCSGVYSLALDSSEGIWAGGEGKSQIWKYNGKEWDSGVKLSDCTDVFVLTSDVNAKTVWAGGRGGKVLWWYNKDKWFSGIILLDCTEISDFTIDAQGGLCAAGAGRNKYWIKQKKVQQETGEKEDWVGLDLDECIAVYAIASGKKMLVAGGWNSQRRGRVWVKKDQTWGKGADLKDCYVIRSLLAVDE